MSLKWFHKLGLTLIDKFIIALALFVVSLDVSQGFSQLGWDLLLTVLTVFLIYVIVLCIANIPNIFIRSENRWVKLMMGGFTAFVVWLAFPKILELFIVITNLFGWTSFSLSVPVQDLLLVTFVIRAFLVGYMKRRWAT